MNTSFIVEVPPSKSQSARAIIFAFLASGRSRIENLLASPDIEGMLVAAEQLGASVQREGSTVAITGVGGKIGVAENVLSVGNSGLGLRFFTALGSLSSYPIVITGDYSIRHRRPSQELLLALRQLGATALSTKEDGFAPLIVQGPLVGGEATLDGADSQPISALLVASLFAKHPSTLIVKNPGELPYIDMTLAWFTKLGLRYSQKNYTHYTIPIGQQIKPFSYRVPGDFSSATFPAAAALVTEGRAELRGLDFTDLQADRHFFTLIEKMGAIVTKKKEGLFVQAKELRGICCDINETIDSLPILSVLACYAKGTTEIRGAGIARCKESDRIAVMTKELRKLGAKIVEEAEGLIIEGGGLQGGQVDSHHDHRVAMALTVGGLRASGKVEVLNTECIAKSYPGFFKDLPND